MAKFDIQPEKVQLVTNIWTFLFKDICRKNILTETVNQYSSKISQLVLKIPDIY